MTDHYTCWRGYDGQATPATRAEIAQVEAEVEARINGDLRSAISYPADYDCEAYHG